MSTSMKLWMSFAGSLLLCGQLQSANRLLIEPQTVKVGEAGVSIPVKLDNDQILYGYSLSLTTNASLLAFVELDLDGTQASGAGWSFGQLFDNGAQISWGVVMDVTDPFDVNNVIPIGQKVLIANLKVNVTAAAAGSATITFQDFPTNPAKKNVLIGDQGVKVAFTSSNGTITIEEEQVGTPFRRGDSDGNHEMQLTDAVRILNHLFLGTGVLNCRDAADADDNGAVELTDAVRILNVLFLGIGVIPPPGSSACGTDPGPVTLGCETYTC